MNAKQHKLRRIWKRKYDANLKMGKQAARIAKQRTQLTSSGMVCTRLSETHRPLLLLGTTQSHIQFFNRKDDGKRNIINP